MSVSKFYDYRFGLLIDLRSMSDQTIHGSGMRLVNSTDGVQLELERDTGGSGKVNCHIFVSSDLQFNLLGGNWNLCNTNISTQRQHEPG